MDFCSKVAVKLLLGGLENKEEKNVLTSPLSYNAIMNMIAAGSSSESLDHILQFLKHKNIEEVNSQSSKFAEITSEQPKKTNNRKIEDESGGDDNKNAGEWGNNIEESGHFYPPKKNIGDAPIIRFLNGAWLNQEYQLKDSFKELIQTLYKAKIRSIDCGKPESVVQETNEWASESTNGLIKDVLRNKHITRSTTLILGNALYFKGSWEEPFKKQLTHPMPFYLLNGEEIEVPFMSGCKKYTHQSFEDFQVARIPYSTGGDVNRNFAMYIFLPKEKDGLKSLLKTVDSNPTFFEQYCVLRKGYAKVDIFWIPKFKFSYLTEKSSEIMKGMGLALENVELSEMIKEEDLPKHQKKVNVSTIIQKAFIEVNEEGTEAAAVTFAFMAFGSCMNKPPPTEFIADHPFMFVIREEHSGILFFAGTVLNPLEVEA